MWKMVLRFPIKGVRAFTKITKLRKSSPRNYCSWWNWHIQMWVSLRRTKHTWKLATEYFNTTHHMQCINKCKMGNKQEHLPFLPNLPVVTYFYLEQWQFTASLVLPFLSMWKWLPFCCFSYQLLLWFKILTISYF